MNSRKFPSTILIPMVEQIIEAHDASILRHGGSPGLRDRGLLEGAVGRAVSAVDIAGVDAIEAAAIVCHGILKSHAFVDGNKRAAYNALLMTLIMNDMMPSREWDSTFLSTTMIRVAGMSKDYSWLLDVLRAPGMIEGDTTCRLLSEHDASGKDLDHEF